MWAWNYSGCQLVRLCYSATWGWILELSHCCWSATLHSNNETNLIDQDGQDGEPIANMIDPMDDVPLSVVGGSEMAAEDLHQQPAVRPVVLQQPVEDQATSTRKLLGRKHRSRPLLCITCKGCGLTTHDEDPFVPGDCVEWLGFESCHVIWWAGIWNSDSGWLADGWLNLLRWATVPLCIFWFTTLQRIVL